MSHVLPLGLCTPVYIFDQRLLSDCETRTHASTQVRPVTARTAFALAVLAQIPPPQHGALQPISNSAVVLFVGAG